MHLITSFLAPIFHVLRWFMTMVTWFAWFSKIGMQVSKLRHESCSLDIRFKKRKRKKCNDCYNYSARESRCTCTLMSWLLFADLSILYSAWFSPIIPKTIYLNYRNVTKNKDILLKIWSKKFNRFNHWIFHFKEIIN